MRRTAVPVGRALVVLTLVSLLAACAPPGQGDGAQGPRLVSNTATPLLLRPREFLANARDLVTLKAAVVEQAPRYASRAFSSEGAVLRSCLMLRSMRSAISRSVCSDRSIVC